MAQDPVEKVCEVVRTTFGRLLEKSSPDCALRKAKGVLGDERFAAVAAESLQASLKQRLFGVGREKTLKDLMDGGEFGARLVMIEIIGDAVKAVRAEAIRADPTKYEGGC